MVEGDAGSGKSKLIQDLEQVMQKEFTEAGHDTEEQPYILKGSFTGEAACNIKGQTLTSLFSLSFGNKYTCLSDFVRAKKRDQLNNLKLLIIDEYSLVKSDMLYQIDQRLKEIKIRPGDRFGGVAVLMTGNLIQLPSVQGNYIFQEPRNDQWKIGYHLDNLWEASY